MTASRGSAANVVGVDIGGTTTELVLLDPAGELMARTVVTTRPGPDLVPGTVAAIRSLTEDRPIARIGIGVPGQVDPLDGSVGLAVNLGLGADPVPLGAMVAAAFGVPVVVENDMRAAALGASRYLLPDAGVLVLVGIGTGVSAGVVIDGRIHRGRSGMAGEIGHVAVAPNGPRCACGQVGCLEAMISGSAIAARWEQGQPAPADGLLAAAADGDPAATRIVDEVMDHLVRALQWLILAYGADHVVLGGGVGSIGAPLLEPIRKRLALAAARSAVAGALLGPERVTCAPADLPLGALGAAALAQTAAGQDGRQPSVATATPDGNGRAEIPTGREQQGDGHA